MKIGTTTAFIFGAIVGAIGSFFVTKKLLEAAFATRAQEEIDEIREYYKDVEEAKTTTAPHFRKQTYTDINTALEYLPIEEDTDEQDVINLVLEEDTARIPNQITKEKWEAADQFDTGLLFYTIANSYLFDEAGDEFLGFDVEEVVNILDDVTEEDPFVYFLHDATGFKYKVEVIDAPPSEDEMIYPEPVTPNYQLFTKKRTPDEE